MLDASAILAAMRGERGVNCSAGERPHHKKPRPPSLENRGEEFGQSGVREVPPA